MKLAVSNIGWSTDQDATISPLLRDAGAEAIEVAPSRLFADIPAATSAQARDIATAQSSMELPIISMQALLFGRADLLLFSEDATAQNLLAYLKHLMQLAGSLGCGPLVFGSPRNRARGSLPFKDAVGRAIPIFRAIGAIATETDTVFCLEANARSYRCDFMTTLAQAADVAAQVNHPKVAIVADTGNMIMEAEKPDAVIAVMDYIRHVHVSAPQLEPVTEHADYIESVLTHIFRSGYEGDITLEMRVPEQADPVATLLQNVTFLRKTIDRLVG